MSVPKIDRNCKHIDKFVVNGPEIQYIGYNLKWHQLHSYKPIPSHTPYWYKTMITHSLNNHIVIGITSKNRLL